MPAPPSAPGARAAEPPGPAADPLAPGSLWIGAGPRPVEARLLAELRLQAAAARRDVSLLARPLRVVVPSRSLREHVAGALVRSLGRGCAGLLVQTSSAAAFEVLERAGAPAPASDLLFPVWLRREARLEPALALPLEALRDGYGAVQAAVSDLLDAGFGAAHAEFAGEALERAGAPPGPARERALALLRVAARLAARIERAELGHRSALYRAARECLESRGAELLPARAVYIHGFADATGVQGDWLEALMRISGASAFLDHPPAASAAAGDARESAFAERFTQRVRGAARALLPQDAAAKPAAAPARAQPEWILAETPEREARRAALEVARAIASGLAPERIAIAARDPARHAVALRRELARLALPFSGVDARVPGAPGQRRLRALAALLERGARTPIRSWVEALEALPRPGAAPRAVGLALRARLERALLARGIAQLDQVAERPAGDGEAELVAEACAAAERCLAALRALERAQRPAALRDALAELADAGLGFAAEGAARRALAGALLEPLAEQPADAALSSEELCELARARFADAASLPLGGAGGGVQCLSVIEARARCFDLLCVIGLNRGHFPRTISEDPLLPDALRRELRSLLPDLPVKSEGHAEERYLFAQLLAANPRALLLGARRESAGAALSPSPLVEALELAAAEPGAPQAREPLSELPPCDALAEAAQGGVRGGFEDFLAAALLERDAESARGGAEPPAPDPARAQQLARSRLAVLRELDAGMRAGLGPYDGFAGSAPAPEGGAWTPAITLLEGVAKCGWQSFLSRRLRLRETPDGELPALDPLRVGSAVHAVLEEIARAQQRERPRDLAAAAGAEPQALAWPEPRELAALARRAVEALCRREGIGFPGYAAALAQRASLHLAQARALDWERASPLLLGAELEGTLALGPGARAVRFRADRVDARRDGGLVLTDYKTGRTPVAATTEKGRRQQLLAAIGSGELLQAAAYARAAQQLGRPAAGRYLFVSPDHPEGAARELSIDAADLELYEVFDSAVLALLEACERGVYPPRLVEPSRDAEPRRCASCDYKLACLRGDSGARGRLRAWTEAQRGALLEAAPAAAERLAPLERALLAIWDPALRERLEQALA